MNTDNSTESFENNFSQTERRMQIVTLVQERGRASVPDLSERFDVSEMTIRRDLRELDREGLLKRVHGGAISGFGRSYEPALNLRANANKATKEAIGRKAAELISDGDSLAFDVGSTTLEIARQLGSRQNLTIITTSLPIANQVAENYSLTSDVRLILAGGIVRSRELSMIGPFAEHTLNELHVDKAFIGVAGVSLDEGLTEYNLEDATVKKSMIRCAHQVIVVADSSKLGKVTFASVASLEAIDTLVTDNQAEEDFLRELEARGVQIIVAE